MVRMQSTSTEQSVVFVASSDTITQKALTGMSFDPTPFSTAYLSKYCRSQENVPSNCGKGR